jgi:tetratricopeptide (TPR) repeat protein
MTEVLSPRALVDEAQAHYRSNDYAAAAQAYLAAAQSFDALADPLTAAEMRNDASVAWLKANQPRAAYNAAEGTPAIFAQANDQRREGLAWGNLAAALEALRRFAEAIPAYEKAVALLEASGETEYRAYALKALAMLKLQTGKQLEALAMLDVSLGDMPKLNASQKLLKSLLSLRSRFLPR